MSNNDLKTLQSVLSELYHVRQTKKAISDKEKLLSSKAIELMSKGNIPKTTFNSNKIACLVERQTTEIDVVAYSELVPADDFFNSIKVIAKQAKKYLSEQAIGDISTITNIVKSIRIS
jgi:hypothetical protein